MHLFFFDYVLLYAVFVESDLGFWTGASRGLIANRLTDLYIRFERVFMTVCVRSLHRKKGYRFSENNYIRSWAAPDDGFIRVGCGLEPYRLPPGSGMYTASFVEVFCLPYPGSPERPSSDEQCDPLR